MDSELNGRVAIVAGCSVGIGREVATVLAGERVQTVVIARREGLLKTLQDGVVAAGGPCPLAMALDVTVPQTPQAIVENTLAHFGRLDMLVNNAGGSRPTAVDAPDAVWEESWTLNFTAVRRLTQACLPAMRTRQWGRIIHMTGSSEPSGINAANPAKAAVHVWAKGLSRVVGRDGITVNCLAPGRIHREPIDQRLRPTEESQRAFAAHIPLGYFGDPADMAYLVACLCSPKARDITGERLHVDGGTGAPTDRSTRLAETRRRRHRGAAETGDRRGLDQRIEV